MKEALNAISNGMFGNAEYFKPLVTDLSSGKDWFCTVVDFEEYMEIYMKNIIPTY